MCVVCGYWPVVTQRKLKQWPQGLDDLCEITIQFMKPLIQHHGKSFRGAHEGGDIQELPLGM